jgi:putative transposase
MLHQRIWWKCLAPTNTWSRPMKYDPFKLHRRSIRLQGYDYAQVGAYFITICTLNRECTFDNVVLRHIAESYWRAIPRHFPNIVLDEWIVMPNHLHGVIVMADDARRGEAFPEARFDIQAFSNLATELTAKVSGGNASPLPTRGVVSASLGALVGNYKSVTTRRINTIRKTAGAHVWQRNYHEHIIRDDNDLDRIRKYIIENPANWDTDEENSNSAPIRPK